MDPDPGPHLIRIQSYHFSRKKTTHFWKKNQALDPNLDPNQHISQTLDPDSHEINADPKPRL